MRSGYRPLAIGADIADRLLELAARALRFTSRLPRDAIGRHVALQWVRSATSAGANYEEARAAESRDDFAHKVSVAAKEAREAGYWTALVHRARWLGSELEPMQREASELAAILAASARTARRHAR